MNRFRLPGIFRNRSDAKSSNAPSIASKREIHNERVSPAPEESPMRDNNLPSSHDQSAPLAPTLSSAIDIAPESRTFSNLWIEALRVLSEDNKRCGILEKYKEAVLSELVRGGFAARGSAVCDVTMQGINGWLRSTSTQQISASKGRDITSMAGKAISSITQVLSAAGGINPYIGLACAGLCILTVPLLNAAEQPKILIEGLDQISLITIKFTSVDQVLKPQPADPPAIREVQAELVSRLVWLFSIVIEYQAKAVYSFVHHKASFFRDWVKADDWAGLLEQINQWQMACSSLVKQIREDRLEVRFARKDYSLQRKLLDTLPRANAAFNSNSLQHQRSCQLQTRVQLLQDIQNWSSNKQGPSIFWLKGLAGTGKSTIARTFASKLHEQQRLAGSFFFARGQGDRGNAKMFFTSLAFQLGIQSEYFCHTICEAINTNRDIIGLNFHEQWRRLISEPLEHYPFDEPHVVVVDALDECNGEDDVQRLLEIISQVKDDNIGMLRFFITCRPDNPMRFGFGEMPHMSFHGRALHDEDDGVVKHDITTYLAFELKKVNRKYLGPGRDWPSQEELRGLADKTGKLFIYAATAIRFINQGGPSLFQERLVGILNDDSDGSEEIDKMYKQVLDHSILNLRAKDEGHFFAKFQRIVGTIVVLFRPLTIWGLERLVSSSGEANDTACDVRPMLLSFGSILDIPEDDDATVNIFHASFRDFILTRERCTIEDFWVSEETTHSFLVDCCFGLMSAKLKRNICNLQDPGALGSELSQNQVNECLPAHVQYACQYWVSHLLGGRHAIRDNDRAHSFLICHFLHWLEALSLIGRLSESISMIDNLLAIADPPGTEVSKLLHDAKRFVLTYRSLLESMPLQAYLSALVFAPKRSIVRNTFLDSIPDWISPLPKVDSDWNAVLQTLEGHESIVNCVAFSSDSKLLASASSSRSEPPEDTLKIWDVATGSLLHTLKGHLSDVNSVTFSSDGRQRLLASASFDSTIKIWNATTGSLQRTLKGHSGMVNSVVFSPDSGLLASGCSGSSDNTIKLWDTRTGSLQHTLKGHSEGVSSVAFSYDSRLASGSHDKTVKIWSTATGILQQTIHQSGWVLSVAFSPDSKLLALALIDSSTIMVCDSTTGSVVQSLAGHKSHVNSVAFSHDSRLLASGSSDNTAKVWDIATDSLQQTLTGHSRYVTSVAFSHDSRLLASGSYDKTAKVWDIAIGSLQQTLQGQSRDVTSVAFSRDSRLLASVRVDDIAKIRNPAVPDQETLDGHRNWVYCVTFSPNSELLASGSTDNTAKIWDALTGSLLHTLKGHKAAIHSVAFSSSSRILATASFDHTLKLWNVVTGSLDETFTGYTSPLYSVSFSPDSVLVSVSGEKYIQIWDTIRRTLKCTLKSHSHRISTVAFSHDSRLLVSGGPEGTRGLKI